MKANVPLVVYVDVDETLIRSAGSKRIPIPNVVAHVKQLAAGLCAVRSRQRRDELERARFVNASPVSRKICHSLFNTAPRLR